MLDALCYITVETIRHDLQVFYATEEIKQIVERYNNRQQTHSNTLSKNLMKRSAERRLGRQSTLYAELRCKHQCPHIL